MDRPIEKKKWPLKRKLLFGSIGVIVITLIVLSVIQTSKRRTKVERAQLLIGDVISGKFREFIPIDGTASRIEMRDEIIGHLDNLLGHGNE